MRAHNHKHTHYHHTHHTHAPHTTPHTPHTTHSTPHTTPHTLHTPHTHTHTHRTPWTHKQLHTQAASGYLCTYVTTLYLWTQNHKQEAFTDTHQSTHRSQGHRCKCLVKAEHVLFDYNIAHHSWRRFYRFSVCAKLSYATDSRHTLAQTIHSPHEAWTLLLSFVWCSAVKIEP